MGKWIGLALVGIFLGGAAFLVIATAATKLPGSEMTPAAPRQTTSVYVTMRDGVEIALTILLPPDLKPASTCQC